MTLYLWIKAIHIIFVIALMAGLLIYPRYKLHQLSSKPGDELFETMKEASNRLRKIILNPALVLVWVLGLTMIYLNQSLLSQGWMHTKLLLVLILSGLHGYFISIGKKIDRGDVAPTSKTLKMLNEVPFLIMIVVVILAVGKPF
ncbi:MAG: CopD family protein [Alphaproteobacteria bacterium]|jgi:protoporphyrinogen IX oxidase|nr:CopD family protein [Henriciella sp.]MBO6694892.1 CopD family protein [Henriciella sp.]MCH9750879.1 CopD family protein [Alphaproteobacteria bacterium]